MNHKILEILEREKIDALLMDARATDTNDDKAVERVYDNIEHAHATDLITHEIAQYIYNILMTHASR